MRIFDGIFGKKKIEGETLSLPERLPYNNAIAIEAMVNILEKNKLIDRNELLEEVKRLARLMKENASKITEDKKGGECREGQG